MASTTREVIDSVDVVGLEFGRFLVLEAYVDKAYPKGLDQLRLKCECSCGFITKIAARHVFAGRASRCKRCYWLYVERYGQQPDRERFTLQDVARMAEERDAAREAERQAQRQAEPEAFDATEYEKLKERLGLL